MDDKEYDQIMNEVDEFLKVETFDLEKYEKIQEKVDMVLESVSLHPRKIYNMRTKDLLLTKRLCEGNMEFIRDYEVKSTLESFFDSHQNDDKLKQEYDKVKYVKTAKVVYKGLNQDLDSLPDLLYNKINEHRKAREKIPEDLIELEDKLIGIVDKLNESNAETLIEISLDSQCNPNKIVKAEYVIKKSVFYYHFFEKKDDSLVPVSLRNIILSLLDAWGTQKVYRRPPREVKPLDPELVKLIPELEGASEAVIPKHDWRESQKKFEIYTNYLDFLFDNHLLIRTKKTKIPVLATEWYKEFMKGLSEKRIQHFKERYTFIDLGIIANKHFWEKVHKGYKDCDHLI
jgi:hypothetical protein